MSFETGAPPPPEHTPTQVEDVPVTAPARPARGYDATDVLHPGVLPPGVTTYRLRGTETAAAEDPPTG